MESSQFTKHEDRIAGKGLIPMTHHNLVHNFIPVLQAMKIPDAKAAVDKEWKKLETIPAWKLDKGKSKKEVILQAQRDKKKVHFAAWMDICHRKNAELEPKLQKYQGRVVLRGDSVEDDSGAYAVFADSSAFQMTAAKVVDVIARLPDCDGQNWRTLPHCSKFLSQNFQTYGYVFHDTHGRHPRQTLTILWYCSNVFLRTSISWIVMGKNSRKFHWNLDGKKYQIGNVCFVHRQKRIILIGIRGR